MKLPGVSSVLRCGVCAAIVTFSAAPANADTDFPGKSELVELEYKREVLGYCGLSDPLAVQGFLDRKKLLISRYILDKQSQLAAASDARQAAYAEWQNRGLGGFRGWCRKEGNDYTSVLQTYIRSQ